jgi:hypothetical protein
MMPEQGAFRQVDEKHVAVEVELMVWSPKFDLVALSNVQGEVRIPENIHAGLSLKFFTETVGFEFQMVIF